MNTSTHVRTATRLLIAMFVMVGAYSVLPVERVEAVYKWNPGHYMDTDSIDRPAEYTGSVNISSAINAIQNTPFKGILIRYSWRLLEPTKDQYDFSRIRAHRDALATAGKRLIIQLQDRDFGTSVGGTPPAWLYPPYLMQDPEYLGGWAYRGNNSGTAPKLWVSAVMDRQIALQAALAREFDGDPWVEIFSFEETSLFGVLPEGYSRTAMATQYQRLADAMSVSWRNTTACILTNYFHSDENLRDLMDYFISKRVCVGGPDVTPTSVGGGSRVLSGRLDGIDRRGRTATLYHNEYNSLDGRFTMQELQDYNHNNNGAHYTTWVKKEGSGLTWTADVRPWIVANNPPTQTACPTAYAGQCAGGGTTPPPTTPSTCTNQQTSTASIPTGYGASYNPLTSAREYLVQASCTGTTQATVTAGNGNPLTYVYNRGYYYSGTAWTPYTLTCASGALIGGAWCPGRATASIPLPQNPTNVIAYTCQYTNSTWKCGCRDATCSTAYWQLQRVGR